MLAILTLLVLLALYFMLGDCKLLVTWKIWENRRKKNREWTVTNIKGTERKIPIDSKILSPVPWWFLQIHYYRLFPFQFLRDPKSYTVCLWPWLSLTHQWLSNSWNTKSLQLQTWLLRSLTSIAIWLLFVISLRSVICVRSILCM